jgi:hypothetical protein
LSETIRIRLPREIIRKLGELTDKEGKNSSDLIHEFLEREIQEKIRVMQCNFIEKGKSPAGGRLNWRKYPYGTSINF